MNIALVDNGQALSNRQKLFETLNTAYCEVVKHLGIPLCENPANETSDISNLLLKAIAKYKDVSCVRLVEKTFKNLNTFSYHYVN